MISPPYNLALAIALLCCWPAHLSAGEIAGPVLGIDPQGESIYGVQYQIRGPRGARACPVAYDTHDASGRLRQTEQIDPHHYGLFCQDLNGQWLPGRIEVFTKLGAKTLTVRWASPGGAPFALRGVTAVKGGFPANPPLEGVPYLDWIHSLRPDRSLARRQPLLRFESGGGDIWTNQSRSIWVTPAQVREMTREMEPYLALTPQRLASLMPPRRGLYFSGGDPSRYDSALRWDPREPDALRLPDGRLFAFEERYPVTGYESVRTPSGKLARYPFHDPPGSTAPPLSANLLDPPPPPANRVYLDGFLTETRIHSLLHASFAMAVLYRATGNFEFGLRAAAILAAFGRVLPDYPVFGRPEWNAPTRQFFAPDAYHRWFAFILNDWYLPGAGRIRIPVRAYDLLRDTPVWSRLASLSGGDPQADIEQGLLHAARLTLKYDAYYRSEPWVFYHNTIAGELTMFIETGRALGCPELVHYALDKVRAAYRANFMADGMFPESTSYLQDMVGGFERLLSASAGDYSDPPGFHARIDGRHIAAFSPRQELPLFARSLQVLRRLRFPDGSPATIHDTWAASQAPVSPVDLSPVGPFLLPDFGHAILGWGSIPDAFEAHLHYSGYYNHGHRDALNFTLWAHGEELASDIGYDHQGDYKSASVSHNLVVVDSTSQTAANLHRGDLLAWFVPTGGTQLVQASQKEAYDSARRYRRALIAVPFGPGRNAIVDIFEVEGGARHEWMANGSADYPQTVEVSLPIDRRLHHLGPAGADYPPNAASLPSANGLPDVFYRTFRDARLSAIHGPWQVTFRGAGQHPGFRLNWLAPLDGIAILCQAPRGRYPRDHARRSKSEAAAWREDTLQKIIVRRDGPSLRTMFATVWESFRAAAWLDEVRRVTSIAESDGFGVNLRSGPLTATALYRTPESDAVLSTGTLRVDGRFGVLTSSPSESTLLLYDGVAVHAGPLSIILPPAARAPLQSLTVGTLTVPVPWPAHPDWLRLAFPGQASAWLPVRSAAPAPGGSTRFALDRDSGLSFRSGGALKELYFPHRTLPGPVTVESINSIEARWTGSRLRLRSTARPRVLWHGRQLTLSGGHDGWMEAAIPAPAGP